MALPNTFARRRRKAAQGGQPEVYFYDYIPEDLRIRLVQIMSEAVGPIHNHPSQIVWTTLVRLMRRETAQLSLSKMSGNAEAEFKSWFLNWTDFDDLMSGLEAFFQQVDGYIRRNVHIFDNLLKPDRAIAEANEYMLEAGLGFQYESGFLVEVSTKITHAELVVPALHLLSDSTYSTANSEYMSAHSDFRGKDYEGCIQKCGNAFESVLKIIGAKRRWAISQNDPAKKLLDAAYDAGFIPASVQAEFKALRALLESGVPALRNKSGGHGAGTIQRVVPRELAAFQLHQTAAAIIFLVEHDAALP